MKILVLSIAYHRNGVAGRGFNVVRFDWKDEEGRLRTMIATIFADENYEPNGLVTVLDIDETAKGNVAFGEGNSWRGDHFEIALLEAIREYDARPSSPEPAAPQASFTEMDFIWARGLGVKL